MTALSVAREFSVTPGGRYRRISDFSGEEFRQNFVEPAVKAGESVEIDLDGVLGYGSSFLEEVFGGIVRAMHWTTRAEFDRFVGFATGRESWRMQVNSYIDDALARERNQRRN